MELEQQIRKYVADNLLSTEDGFEYSNDSSFISEGLIDSVGVMELVAFVQSQFAITIDQREVTPDNFDSVNKLATFIRCKQGSGSEAAKGQYAGSGRIAAQPAPSAG